MAFLMSMVAPVVMAKDNNDIILLLPAIKSLELSDGNGIATFWYTPHGDHKAHKVLMDYIKKLYNENPSYYNGRDWDFRDKN